MRHGHRSDSKVPVHGRSGGTPRRDTVAEVGRLDAAALKASDPVVAVDIGELGGTEVHTVIEVTLHTFPARLAIEVVVAGDAYTIAIDTTAT